jgi:hypothetical protein
VNRHNLQERLDSIGVDRRRYSLDAGTPDASEGLVLAWEGRVWLVKHFERGSWYTLRTCVSEEEACEAFLEYASDPFYRAKGAR